MRFHEKSKRSLLKAVTFRLVVLTSDFLVILFITRRFDATLTLVIFTNLASTLLYYGHERVWNRIHWGRTRVHRSGRKKRLATKTSRK
ncbi:MAG: DUF2061 domain-containing protein [Candidatus Saccharibacteria bacterium]|jgi:adenylylsulfate kinase